MSNLPTATCSPRSRPGPQSEDSPTRPQWGFFKENPFIQGLAATPLVCVRPWSGLGCRVRGGDRPVQLMELEEIGLMSGRLPHDSQTGGFSLSSGGDLKLKGLCASQKPSPTRLR